MRPSTEEKRVGEDLCFPFSSFPRQQIEDRMNGGERIQDKREGYQAPFSSVHKSCDKL